MNAQRIVGLVFVAIGGALLVATTTTVGGEIVVAALGVAFLVAYVSTRSYGLLIPGAILTGLGAGVVAAEQGAPGGSVPLGLGLGFLAIAVIDRATGASGSAWWWPLIPGGILTVAGGTDVAGVGVQTYIVPVVLIVVGLALLLRPGPRRERATASTGAAQGARGPDEG